MRAGVNTTIPAITVLLNVVMLEAAIETYWRGSPVRWVVLAIALAYGVGIAVAWQRFTWRQRAIAAALALGSSLAVTIWLHGGLVNGMSVAGASTSTLLSLIVGCAIAWAAVVLVRTSRLPTWARAIVFALAAYGAAAFFYGVAAGVPFAALLSGGSIWQRLPAFLQGSAIGGLVVLPLAIVVAAVRAGLRRQRDGSVLREIQEIAALTVALAMVVAGLPLRQRNDQPAPATASTPAAAKPQLSTEQRLAQLDNSLRAIEDGDREAPRGRWDPEYVVQKIGRDPKVLFEWVRDNTFWIPYRGTLRGPIGVLMDRQGNSLDRALLLAELLQKAGHPVRLAHAELPLTDAWAMLPALVSSRPLPADDDYSRTPPVALRRVASGYGMDGESVDTAVASQATAMVSALARVETRAAAQADRLRNAVRGAGEREERAARARAAVEAARDHWFVRLSQNGVWSDLDLAGGLVKSRPSVSEVEPGQIDASLEHSVNVRLVAERWSNGSLSATPLFDYRVRAADAFSKRVDVSIWPNEWPAQVVPPGADPRAAMRTTALEQHAWRATLVVDKSPAADVIVQDDGAVRGAQTGGGFGGLGQAIASGLGGAQGSGAVLTSVWLEYEIRQPSAQARTIRRVVFDLLGTSGRTNPPKTLQLTESPRLTRALAMMRTTELLLTPAQVAPEYVSHLAARAISANADLARLVVKREVPADPQQAQDLAGKATAPPSALYPIVLARFHGSAAPREVFLDRLNLFTRHKYLDVATSAIVARHAIDIVANEVGVDLRTPDGFRARLQQGVLDTNAEAIDVGSLRALGNVATSFAAGDAALTLRSPDDVARAQLTGKVRDGILKDVAAGYVVVVRKNIDENALTAGWWRIDPTSGDTLGVGKDGWGQSMLERAVIMAGVFAAAWTFEYLLCGGALGNFVPNQTTASNRSWLSRMLVTPVYAAESTCSEQAFWAGMLAFALELLNLIWPFFAPRIFGPTYNAPEPPPGWKLGDPPNWEPKPGGAPAPAPAAPEPECSPGAASVPPQPAAPGKTGAPPNEAPPPEESFYGGPDDKLIPRPVSDSAMQKSVARAAEARRQAEQAYDEALAAQQQAKATASQSESEMQAAKSKTDDLHRRAPGTDESNDAYEEFLAASRKYRADAEAADRAQSALRQAEYEVKRAEYSEWYWRQVNEVNAAARTAGEELNAADARFGEYLRNGGRFEGPEYDAWRSAIARYDAAYKKFVDALRGAPPPVNAGGSDPTLPAAPAPGGNQVVNAGDGANAGDPTVPNVPPATPTGPPAPPGSAGGSAGGCGGAKAVAGAANANAVGAPQ